MMYHRWPEQGRGSHSYEWNGQTLSADFNHAYRWNLMLPSYLGNYTEEQALEVARLMYDVGVSVNMYYNESGSGASFNGSHMVEFFDYDKNTRTLSGDYCSTEDWEDVMRTELAAARPVLCSGGSQGGAHEFVCDGYNAEGLFHYNYGWNGVSNGWFASTATGFDASPSIDYGIEKNHGGTGALSLMSCNDFVWTSGNDLSGDLRITCTGLDYETANVTIEVALAVKNVQTGQVSYYAKLSHKTSGMVLPVLSLNDEVPDGTYQVYPVSRLAGEEEWQTFYHNAMRQIVVDLTVSGGVISVKTEGDPDAASCKALKAKTGLTVSGGVLTLDSADHAVHSAAGIAVSGGSFEIKSAGKGFAAHGGVSFTGGAFTLHTADDAVETKGNIDFSGGAFSIVSGADGVKAGEKNSGVGSINIDGGAILISTCGDSFDAQGEFVVRGGNVLALGSSKRVKGFSADSTQGFVQCEISGGPGSTVRAGDDSLEAEYAYNLVLYSAPELVSGGECAVTASGRTETVTVH